MEQILWIDACPRADSRTRELAQALIDGLSGEITRLDLYDLALAPLDEEGIALREKAAKSGNFSHPAFALARQFAAADRIVIAAPYWDLLFPAVLRTYLEQVTVSGITFVYPPKGGAPVGLCRAKRLYYLTTAGGVMGQNDFGYRYVEALSKTMFGIEQVLCFSAQGLDMDPASAKERVALAKEQIRTALAK